MTHGWQVVVGKMLPFDWPDPFSSRPWTWARNLSLRIGWRSRCGLRRPRCRWPESPFRRTPDCCRTSTVSVDISFFNFSQQQQLKKSTSTLSRRVDERHSCFRSSLTFHFAPCCCCCCCRCCGTRRSNNFCYVQDQVHLYKEAPEVYVEGLNGR